MYVLYITSDMIIKICVMTNDSLVLDHHLVSLVTVKRIIINIYTA